MHRGFTLPTPPASRCIKNTSTAITLLGQEPENDRLIREYECRMKDYARLMKEYEQECQRRLDSTPEGRVYQYVKAERKKMECGSCGGDGKEVVTDCAGTQGWMDCGPCNGTGKS